MGFKKTLVDFLSSFLLLSNRFVGLILNPYKTMRKISLEKDYWQPGIIIGLIFIYFKFIYYLRDKIYPATFIYVSFVINFFLTVTFFYLVSKLFSKNKKEVIFSNFLFTFSYSLLPTLVWFLLTSFLFIFIPPPRTFSLLGKGFSIFFITYSSSLLIWKLLLFYLAVRFSSKQNFYKVIYMILLYLLWFTPYSIFLYSFKLFRIPFI